MANVLSGGFRGPVWPVNLRHPVVAGLRACATPAQLPKAPDLAVICTPAATIPALIDELGTLGTRAAVVLSAGLEVPAVGGGTLAAAMLQAARRQALRVLGPNCIGLLVPGIGLNASFAHVGARPGGIAFIAQSGALISALLDWAQGAGIGFSHCISLGNAADVDFGDLLDYLGRDPRTRAILLYIESITGARKFMSAARAAARNKPVIAVKAGRTAQAAKAATSHSGALAGADAVYEAALRRAGVLRVRTTRQLFEAAQILSQYRSYVGPRLAIVSNGGGPAVLATDALIEGHGELATLAPQTLQQLGTLLPGGWPKLMAINRGLALEARADLCESLGIDPPCPESMIGSMASVVLPRAASGAAASRLEGDALTGWFRDRGVETWLSRRPFNLLRVSAQLYNSIAQVHRLTELTLQALHEPSAAH